MSYNRLENNVSVSVIRVFDLLMERPPNQSYGKGEGSGWKRSMPCQLI